jgi:hypothetical protein
MGTVGNSTQGKHQIHTIHLRFFDLLRHLFFLWMLFDYNLVDGVVTSKVLLNACSLPAIILEREDD